jgi:hypothetical protein
MLAEIEHRRTIVALRRASPSDVLDTVGRYPTDGVDEFILHTAPIADLAQRDKFGYARALT